MVKTHGNGKIIDGEVLFLNFKMECLSYGMSEEQTLEDKKKILKLFVFFMFLLEFMSS